MIAHAVPKASPDPLPELDAYLTPFAPLFRRAQSRQSLERYVTGLLTDLAHKTADTIAAAVAGTTTERLQHLLTDAEWDPEALDAQRVRMLTTSSPPDGVLVLDDTGFAKQGRHSVGVARQYSGTLGKVGNCQIVVSAEYVVDATATTPPWHWPVSAQLYLPNSWAADPQRCTAAHVPEAVAFQTKPAIALALIDQARQWEVPFGVVVTDAGYGDNPAFLEGLEERKLAYVCAVERGFGVRLPDEVQAAAATRPPRGGRGRPKLPRPAPLHTAEALTEALPSGAWQTITWREGTRGPLRKQFAALCVHWATGSPVAGHAERSTTDARVRTGPAGWLLGERPLPEEEGERKWYFALLPADTPLLRLVRLAHSRWAVEQFYEESKGECGLDDFQGRRWDGLHRHLALVMLAYSFLVQQRLAATDSDADQAGLSPLSGSPQLAGHPPAGVGLAAAGSRALVHRYRPDQDVPPPTQLTK
jgi:SRSO17 transposase